MGEHFLQAKTVILLQALWAIALSKTNKLILVAINVVYSRESLRNSCPDPKEQQQRKHGEEHLESFLNYS